MSLRRILLLASLMVLVAGGLWVSGRSGELGDVPFEGGVHGPGFEVAPSGSSAAGDAEPESVRSSVVVEPEGGGPRERHVERHGEILAVRVLDRATGEPAIGVRVSLPRRQRRALGFTETLGEVGVETDPDGLAAVPIPRGTDGEQAGGMPLLALQGGGFSTVLYWTRRGPRGERGAMTRYVDRSGSVSGRISFPRPLGEDATVRLSHQLTEWPGGASFYGRLHGEAPIGPDGRFHVDNVPPNVAFDVEVVDGGDVVWTAPGGLELRPGETRRVDWSAALATVRIRGIEQDHREPAGFEVTLNRVSETGGTGAMSPETGNRGGWARANEWGVATVEGVSQGRWRASVLRGSIMDYGPMGTSVVAPVHIEFEVIGDGRGVDLEVPLHRTEFLQGTFVLAPELRGVRFRLRAVGDGGTFEEPVRRLRRVVSIPYRKDGESFRLGPVPPGRYEIHPASGQDPRLCVFPPVILESGADPLDVHICVGGILPVHLQDDAASLQPARGSLVVRTGGLGEVVTWPFTRSITLRGLNGQALTLLARSPDGRMCLASHPGVEPGESADPIELHLREAARLQVKNVRGSRWVQATAFQGDLQVASVWLAPGCSGELRVAPGDVEVVYTAGWGPSAREELRRERLAVEAGMKVILPWIPSGPVTGGGAAPAEGEPPR